MQEDERKRRKEEGSNQMKSKKKNSQRSHRNYKPFEMFRAHAQVKKYRKDMRKKGAEA
jgi:hypothetical protein